MRIAQVAPLAESVPPKLYGGTERVVSWLTEELVQLGHDVTLFASADSHTNGSLGLRVRAGQASVPAETTGTPVGNTGTSGNTATAPGAPQGPRGHHCGHS